jgi:D-alanyl-lipoteichoic acid acyltransferase DltB (MBOAT superfamily)
VVFSSFAFILSFFAFLGVFFLLPTLQARKIAVLLFSLYFYAAWNVWFAPLLIASILLNYAAIRIIQTAPWRLAYVAVPIALNILVLAYFKYAGFLAEIVGVRGFGRDIILPLGLSFFTFHNITALVYFRTHGRQDVTLLDYANYILFFPQLIAGPIVRYDEIFQQWTALRDTTGANVYAGLKVFTIGMFKKVALADMFAGWSDPVFDDPASGESASFFEAWMAANSYYFQIYFDFSGYSLMAVGLAICFGIRLPINFNRPYTATSISEFWRRWHITLSRFLRDYLYIPLGGNRRGRPRQYANLLITMLIGGLWHGAGWTFVIWGGLHGLFLTVNHAWDSMFESRFDAAPAIVRRVKSVMAWGLTYAAVISAWVLFRAQSLEQAGGLLRTMWAPGEIVFPNSGAVIAELGQAVGLQWRAADLAYYYGGSQVLFVLAGFVLVFFGRADERVGVIQPGGKVRSLDFGPVGEPLIYAGLFVYCLWRLTAGNSVFIYYQF